MVNALLLHRSIVVRNDTREKEGAQKTRLDLYARGTIGRTPLCVKEMRQNGIWTMNVSRETFLTSCWTSPRYRCKLPGTVSWIQKYNRRIRWLG